MDILSALMDPGINIAVQNISPAVTQAFALAGELDSMPWYLFILSIVYLGFHPRSGARLSVLVGICVGFNEALKLAWHMPRPYWISQAVQVFENHSSFGFPSGGAMIGAVMYGYIALTVRRMWVILSCMLLLVSVCLARIFIGAHFVLDIIGGLGFGFLLLLVFFLTEPHIEKIAAGLSRPSRWIGIVVLSFLPLLLVLPAYLSLASWQVPAAWIEIARMHTGSTIHPVTIQFAWDAMGIILGCLAGYEVLSSYGGWEPPANLLQRIVVAMVGAASVLVGYACTVTIKSALSAPFSQGLSVLCLAAVLFWLACGVPLIARRAGIGLRIEH